MKKKLTKVYVCVCGTTITWSSESVFLVSMDFNLLDFIVSTYFCFFEASWCIVVASKTEFQNHTLLSENHPTLLLSHLSRSSPRVDFK